MILLGDFNFSPQLVKRQPADEIIGDIGPALQEERVRAGARDQEIEKDLALRRQQCARPRYTFRQGIEVGRDDVLQEMFRFGAGNSDEGTIGQMDDSHGAQQLAFRKAIT